MVKHSWAIIKRLDPEMARADSVLLENKNFSYRSLVAFDPDFITHPFCGAAHCWVGAFFPLLHENVLCRVVKFTATWFCASTFMILKDKITADAAIREEHNSNITFLTLKRTQQIQNDAHSE